MGFVSDDSFLDLGGPPQPARADAYRVLARKYRPQTFDELIGQDAMVQTLANAIQRGRLAHAFLLTGVRGVGKTTTARLIAKALNCIGPDGQSGPTIEPCGVCEPCRAIAEGRHIDVIEMDAASHTGVDDVREIIDAARYAAVSARFKIYIIDEVHMLSKNAFNALLKTLEEPPGHVKFLFATTEVNKVPVTVLSRCQRFDLRRIPAEKLGAHFAAVVEKEGVDAEPEALALIARAAEGSARDGLSMLDQAIAHADMDGGQVRADAVRDMLGLSDRGATRTLMGLVLAGDAGEALAALRRQYALGVDPLAVLRALLETVHAVTLVKVGAPADAAQSAEEREQIGHWAEALSHTALHRLWQMLLRGHDEVARAALPIEACEMALLRVIHAAALPDPGELAKQIASGSVTASVAAPPAATPAPQHAPAASAGPATFADLLTLIDANRMPGLAEKLRFAGRVVRYEPPEIVLSSLKPMPAELPQELAEALYMITRQRWTVTAEEQPGAPSVREQEAAARDAELERLRATPIISAALETFPEAEIVGYPQDQRSIGP